MGAARGMGPTCSQVPREAQRKKQEKARNGAFRGPQGERKQDTRDGDTMLGEVPARAVAELYPKARQMDRAVLRATRNRRDATDVCRGWGSSCPPQPYTPAS